MLTDEYDRKLRLIEKASEPLRRLGYTDICAGDDDIMIVTAKTEWRRDEIAGRAVMKQICFVNGTEFILKSIIRRYGLYDVSVIKAEENKLTDEEREACKEYHRFLKENIVAQKDGHDSDEEWIRGGALFAEVFR